MPQLSSNQNELFGFTTTSTTSPTSTSREKNNIFIHTSPTQIVRQHASYALVPSPVRINSPPEMFQQPSLPPTYVGPVAPASSFVVNFQNINSSTKSSQRGRPKGSKNKPKSLLVEF